MARAARIPKRPAGWSEDTLTPIGFDDCPPPSWGGKKIGEQLNAIELQAKRGQPVTAQQIEFVKSVLDEMSARWKITAGSILVTLAERGYDLSNGSRTNPSRK